VLAGVACALLFAHWITRALASLTLGVRRLHFLKRQSRFARA
jgi:hypothetical protein